MTYCHRCGHELHGELCNFCLAEMLGAQTVGPAGQPDVTEGIGAFLRALFIKHWSLKVPLVWRAVWR